MDIDVQKVYINQRIFYRFLFSTLIISFFTVSISSGLLVDTNNVRLASASLLTIDFHGSVHLPRGSEAVPQND